jgi:hypothetical protein
VPGVEVFQITKNGIALQATPQPHPLTIRRRALRRARMPRDFRARARASRR